MWHWLFSGQGGGVCGWHDPCVQQEWERHPFFRLLWQYQAPWELASVGRLPWWPQNGWGGWWLGVYAENWISEFQGWYTLWDQSWLWQQPPGFDKLKIMHNMLWCVLEEDSLLFCLLVLYFECELSDCNCPLVKMAHVKVHLDQEPHCYNAQLSECDMEPRGTTGRVDCSFASYDLSPFLHCCNLVLRLDFLSTRWKRTWSSTRTALTSSSSKTRACPLSTVLLPGS